MRDDKFPTSFFFFQEKLKLFLYY